MKKILSFILVACFTATLFGQTIVSTEPSQKNVLLEEYTGTNCVYCPDGHKIAAQIMASNPGRAWAINIHQGGFSGNDPDYKTPWGNALANQYSINSYPNGTLNRGTSPVPRNQWAQTANSIMQENSPVNVAATANINWTTRELTVYVEVYYTANAANSTNKLNVALLQDNILGPQTGGSTYYPAMWKFNTYYQHMHMLRDLLTGQWGEDIPTTTQGTLYTNTITYPIPEHVRNVPIYLEDIKILAFVCENNKTILNACEAAITHENKPDITGRIEKLDGKLILSCDGDYSATCFIRNSNNFAANSLGLTYTIADGTSNVYNWNARTIPANSYDTVQLPVFSLVVNENQNIVATISKINEQNSNLTINKNLKKEVVIGEEVMKLIIATDRYASETTFKVFNPDGTVLFQGGPWGDLGSNTITVREFDFIPTMDGCHRVEVYDSYGDGINAGYGAGYVKILNAAGQQIYYNDGKFGAKLQIMVSVGEAPPPPPTYYIVASAGENGTISPIGETEYEEGETAEYIFTPDADYEVDNVYIDNEIIELENTTGYTFPSVNKDYTIHVTFKPVVGIKDINGTTISVAPNPVKDKLYITGMYDKLEIYSITGQVISTIYGHPSVDVTHLSKGIYFVKIESNGQISTFKVIK